MIERLRGLPSSEVYFTYTFQITLLVHIPRHQKLLSDNNSKVKGLHILHNMSRNLAGFVRAELQIRKRKIVDDTGERGILGTAENWYTLNILPTYTYMEAYDSTFCLFRCVLCVHQLFHLWVAPFTVTRKIVFWGKNMLSLGGRNVVILSPFNNIASQAMILPFDTNHECCTYMYITCMYPHLDYNII